MQTPAQILEMTVEEVLTREPEASTVLGRYYIDLGLTFPLSVRAAAVIGGAPPEEVARAIWRVHQLANGKLVLPSLMFFTGC
jgi:hypothetical protein